MPLVERQFRSIYAALFAIFTLYGATMVVIGAALPRILADFGWSYSAAGFVMAMGSVGTFGSTWLIGRFIGKIGARQGLLIGLGLDAVAFALFALIPSPLYNGAIYLVVGLGQGFLEVSINWAVLRMDRSGSGRAMSLVHGAFALGAVLGPLAAGVVLGSGSSVVIVYQAAALICFILCLLLLALPFGRLGREGSARDSHDGVRGSPAASGDSHRHGTLAWIGGLALLLYVGAELGVSNWSAELFVRSFRSSETFGALAVSLFWVGLLAGRFGFPIFLPRIRQEKLILALSTGFAISVSLLVISGAAGPVALLLAAVAVFLAGLAASGIYPAVISLIGASNPRSPGPAIGFAVTGGGMGAFLFPFVMSGIATAWGVLAGFGFYAFIAIAGAVAVFALARGFARRRMDQ